MGECLSNRNRLDVLSVLLDQETIIDFNSSLLIRMLEGAGDQVQTCCTRVLYIRFSVFASSDRLLLAELLDAADSDL